MFFKILWREITQRRAWEEGLTVGEIGERRYQCSVVEKLVRTSGKKVTIELLNMITGRRFL